MKYAKSFLLAFVLAAVAGYLSHVKLGTSLPNLVQTGIEKYMQSKTAAKSFPISIYLLLMASALTELLISFKVSPKLMQLARDKALGRVLKVGGALIGVITGMTTAFYQAGNSTDVKVGLGLILMVATFLITPILIATSLRLLTEDDPSSGRAKVLRWTIRICCSAIVLIATYGIVDEATKKVGSENGQAPARTTMLNLSNVLASPIQSCGAATKWICPRNTGHPITLGLVIPGAAYAWSWLSGAEERPGSHASRCYGMSLST